MPIDPYAALNAMLRAEVARFSPPARQEAAAPDRPAGDPHAADRHADRSVPQPATAGAPKTGAAAAAGAGSEPRQDTAGSAA
ncbi:hypothetical protein ACFY7H_04785 [Streptomyces sp. NPDC012794]|uniref:hypothetical protein n=1 Tax=Streptomyces sp. NPDC012794 TaxID=3364850 RepID=UPI00369F3BF6